MRDHPDRYQTSECRILGFFCTRIRDEMRDLPGKTKKPGNYNPELYIRISRYEKLSRVVFFK
jgi:hypothetical protein